MCPSIKFAVILPKLSRMVFLILSILSSTSIYILFKLISHLKIHTFSAIVVNYFTACLAGFFLCNSQQLSFHIFSRPWFPISIVIGVLFIVMFYTIARSTQEAGISVTTVAVKMSVVFPIAFSIWYDAFDVLTTLKLSGIVLAVLSVFLVVFQKGKGRITAKAAILPLILFIGMGMVDTLVKYSQSTYIDIGLAPLFSTAIFASALLTGIVSLLFNHRMVQLKSVSTWLMGIALGIVNFGSTYFLILALNHVDISTGKQASGSVVFGINNLAIVALSVLAGYLLFKERPSRMNWLGIALSGVAIVLLMRSQF